MGIAEGVMMCVLCAAPEPGGEGPSTREARPIRLSRQGALVRIEGPEGFGAWLLNLPEKLMLDFGARPAGNAAERPAPEGGLVVTYTLEEGEFAHAFTAAYALEKDAVRITTEVENRSRKAWKVGGEIMACLRSERCAEFAAPGDMGKTFAAFNGRLEAITHVAKEAWGGRMPAMPSLAVKGAEETFGDFKKGDPVFDDGPIVFVSTSGRRLVAFAWDAVRRVSMNPAYPCIHSNPRVTGLKPGEKEARVGRIYFLEGALEDFAKRYAADFKRPLVLPVASRSADTGQRGGRDSGSTSRPAKRPPRGG